MCCAWNRVIFLSLNRQIYLFFYSCIFCLYSLEHGNHVFKDHYCFPASQVINTEEKIIRIINNMIIKMFCRTSSESLIYVYWRQILETDLTSVTRTWCLNQTVDFLESFSKTESTKIRIWQFLEGWNKTTEDRRDVSLLTEGCGAEGPVLFDPGAWWF